MSTQNGPQRATDRPASLYRPAIVDLVPERQHLAAYRALAADRWRGAAFTVSTYDGETDLSKTYRRLMGSVREMVGRMVDGIDGADDHDRYDDGCDRIMQTIEAECVGLAVTMLVAREPGR